MTNFRKKYPMLKTEMPFGPANIIILQSYDPEYFKALSKKFSCIEKIKEKRTCKYEALSYKIQFQQ